jgi:transcriptional regulator with XRE-family HTH domain
MLGNRLREERDRVGMTQPVFAEAAGAKKRTLIDWEKGVSSPTATQLEALAAIGVDVLYVLTGRRAPAANGLAVAEPGPLGHLTLPELGLIKGWRQLDAKGRQAVMATIEALTQASPGQTFNAPVQNVAGRDVKQSTTGDVTQGKGGRIG